MLKWLSDYYFRYDLITTCSGPFQTQNIPVSTIPRAGSAPCYTKITDKIGTINTPHYPKPYPSNLDCIYEFVK